MATKKDISAADFLPDKLTIKNMRTASQSCKGCHLYKNATQAVFGDGDPKAQLMVVGEIPGDKEDQTGKPFTGPAGTFMRKSIDTAGLDLEDIYFTNVVKHFKFTLQNKRRIHRSPTGSEIRACMPWLKAEIAVVKPKVILCLGAIAAKALVSNNVRLTEQRGKWLNFSESTKLIITFHPSAILRAITSEDRHRMTKLFINDIKKIAIFFAKVS